MKYQMTVNKEIGRLRTGEGKYIIVRLTRYDDEPSPLIDIRYWQDSDEIKGFSRKGVRIPQDKIDKLVALLTEPITKEQKDGHKQ